MTELPIWQKSIILFNSTQAIASLSLHTYVYIETVCPRIQGQRGRWEYARPRADYDHAGPEYWYLDWYPTANTDYV